jgi:hypothetical protein
METYLRLMALKFRYRLGYESLCPEVADSITWRRLYRIPMSAKCAAGRLRLAQRLIGVTTQARWAVENTRPDGQTGAVSSAVAT